MSVITDIAATYRGPRRVVRRIIAAGPREDRALAILMDISRAITSDLYIEDILKLIVMVTAKVTGVEICSMWLIDENVNPIKVRLKATQAIDPDYVGALSLMLIPGTPLFDDLQSAKFTLIEPDEMLAELRTMIAGTNLSRGLFHANHASNYLPIKARLPKDKELTLQLIDRALAGEIALKPEYLRAL